MKGSSVSASESKIKIHGRLSLHVAVLSWIEIHEMLFTADESLSVCSNKQNLGFCSFPLNWHFQLYSGGTVRNLWGEDVIDQVVVSRMDESHPVPFFEVSPSVFEMPIFSLSRVEDFHLYFSISMIESTLDNGSRTILLDKFYGSRLALATDLSNDLVVAELTLSKASIETLRPDGFIDAF